ncbi:hypothetical protein DPMN_126366 [Dreissena polymorpha]|uniref:Uncharacterized protein n=1 Tax=Dreissena polymorpha TaxID=45954 RepID=A0A9D4GVZ0_DREPO|nr:hypothetical protein DPMN_126366 [Dreissena polymorpha]
MACSKVFVDDNNNDQRQRNYFKKEIIENDKVKSHIMNITLSMSVADVVAEMFVDGDEIVLVKNAFVEKGTQVRCLKGFRVRLFSYILVWY